MDLPRSCGKGEITGVNKIEEIKKSLEVASPSPWEILYGERGNIHIHHDVQEVLWDVSNIENARLIAKSPEYIEYLLNETDRLRKALEEVQQTVLYSDVSSAETLCIVYGIVNQALEPAKGVDNQ